MSDFPLATDHHTPSQYWFDSINPIAIVIHETGGDRDLPSLFNTFNTSNRSVHYGIGRDDKGNDGAIWQFVPESHGAGGNCCLETGHDPFWDSLHARYDNLNLCTLSVEHCNADLQNMAPLTQAQIETSFKLIAYWVKKYNIPLTNIKGHSSLDPLDRKNCPGPYYPWAELFAYLQGVPVIRNAKGENADIPLFSQFRAGRTEFACGFDTAANCKYAGLPGKGPSGTPEQAYQWGDAQYKAEYGSDGPTMTGGVSIDDMHRLFKTAGNLHYWDILAISPNSQQASDIAHVRAALNAGYLMAITVDESTVHDLDLNGANPYSWNPPPGPTHVMLLTGPGQPGSYFLAEDTANVVGPLQGNNTVRPGPRKYDENKIGIHWASIVQLVGPDANHPWMKPIPSGEPTTWPMGYNAQNFGGTQPMNWPSQGMQQQASDTWNITAKYLQLLGANVSYNSGIALAWQEAYKKGHNYGPPLTPEIESVDWSNKPIKVQLFQAGVRAEWNGSCHWFDKNGPIS